MMRTLSAVIIVCNFVATCPARASEPMIEWRVENPFRFFSDPVATEHHARAVEQAGSILGAERLLAAAKTHGWAEDVFRATCWDLMRQDHSACGGLDAYVNPSTHRVRAKLTGVARGAMCLWSMQQGRKSHQGWRGLSKPCGQEVVFDVPYPTGGSVQVSIGGHPVATAQIKVRDLLVLGLGDSYASGEGNPDRPVRWRDDATASFGQVRGVALAGYPQRRATTVTYRDRQLVGPSAFWLSQPCHRSLYSHQLRVALGLAIEDPHRAVTFVGLSCSGSEITSGLLTAWKGVERFPTTPRRSQLGRAAVVQCGGRGVEVRNYATSFTDAGRVPSLNGLVLERCPLNRARKVDLVLLSIGGNDIGFAKLVAYAILHGRSPLRRVSEIAEQVFTPRDARARFRELESRFKLLRRALHNHLHIPWDEPHRILLTAYPKIAIQRDGRRFCDDANEAGLDGFPAYRLDPDRTAEAEAVSAELDDRLRSIARRYGWTFVHEHRARFAGRGICAGHETDGGTAFDELRLPRWTGRAWLPYAPSDFAPYAPRQRWIRTSNDAFLSAHVDLSSDLRRQIQGAGSYKPTDLLKASTFGGAFHPTAEGQAAIADAVLPLARRVIERVEPK